MTNEEIADLVAEYDSRRALGITHDEAYVLRMERYRIVLDLG